MGNIYELDDDECEDEAVAKEIINMLNLVCESDIDAEASEFVKKFTRTGGLIERLNTYFDFDLKSFDKENKHYKYERCKILYFFYMLENVYFYKTNVLMLLSKPSMENIDNSPIDMKTYNGHIIKLIKDSLEKELSSSPIIEKVKNTTESIVRTWDGIIENAYHFMNSFYENECEYDFKETIHSLMYPQKGFEKKGGSKYYAHSPIETLYLKIVQHEYIGNITDIAFVNSIQKNYDNRSPELIEEMKKFYYSAINLNDVEQYIQENASRISKYVYLGAKTTKEDIRRIRNSKEKVRKLIDFSSRGKSSLYNIKEISNELQVISFLQVIILDEKNEIFDYIFYGYQEYNKHKPRVQAALKNNNDTCDALKVYLIRKFTDHFYLNIGKYAVRVKMRELEKAIDHILIEILSKSNLYEMQETHDFYMNKIDKELIATKNQAITVQSLISYLSDKGFEYIDKYNKIHYAFLYPYKIGTYNSSIKSINLAIENKEPLLQITDGIDFNLELAFDYQNNKCILQKLEFISI